MPRKMIRVRHKETGQETTVAESAYGYFAGHYDRLDEQPAQDAESPQEPAKPSPQGSPAPNAPDASTRRTAARNDKE